ncbi:MAG: hypothetical protein VW547_13620 [Alphaproteobacteria bacterium]
MTLLNAFVQNDRMDAARASARDGSIRTFFLARQHWPAHMDS